MQHLNDEALARLVDEEPMEDEALHLERCETCRSELDALREQTRELGVLPLAAPPAGQWGALEARLAEEGLLFPPSMSGRYGIGWPWRAAAAVALFVGGSATGFLARGIQEEAPVAQVDRPPGSVVEAAEQLRRTETEYTAALARFAELSGVDQPEDLVSRLAALEGIVLTTRAALEEAPADPVINGYHLTALGQRDALLREIERSTPQDNADQEWF